jgi:hypothetical protein
VTRRARAAGIVAAALALGPAATADAAALRAGAGRADITPPTGYPLLGWARGDARAVGQHTRLFARALVVQRGGRTLALVAEDLNAIPGGMVRHALERVRDLGLRERDVVVSATHTHAGPTGFANFLFKDAAVPTPRLPQSGVSDPDPALYAFMVRRLALALRRAHAGLAPAVAGWGARRLTGVTRNRSLEAHLAGHGIHLPRGRGSAAQDPSGPSHTIDPEVDVLRVDRLARGRRLPLAAWSSFANHGTVQRATFPFYNADHHATAGRVVEAALRRAGRVPRGQEVVAVFANGAAGDASAGLDRHGPAHAEHVGRSEARAILGAWRSAGRRMTSGPALGTRWTRICFCGQDAPGGPVDDHAVFGKGYSTGSEEGRGPLFDALGVVYEGERLAAPVGRQGVKIAVRSDDARTLEPTAVPLTAARIGDRVLLTVPGEMTTGLGRRTRAAALRAVAGTGLRRAVIAGYANEYASYFTTRAEYDAQHYEGATTVFGPGSGGLVGRALARLAGRLAHGRRAPPAHPFDPVRGLRPFGPRYPAGARAGTVVAQPGATERLGRAVFRWRGGASGTDRPLDRAFVTVERLRGGRWRPAADDLGLHVLWRVDDDRAQVVGPPSYPVGERGTATAEWHPGRAAPTGTYRFVVTARRYRLRSRPFALRPARSLRVTLARRGRAVSVALRYPAAVPDRDLAGRPARAPRGRVTVVAGGRARTLPLRRGRATVAVPRGGHVCVARGAGRDVHGNRNGRAASS